MLGFRTKLILVSLALFSVAGLAGYLYFEATIRKVVQSEIAVELNGDLAAFRVALEHAPKKNWDTLARDMSRQTGAHYEVLPLAGTKQKARDTREVELPSLGIRARVSRTLPQTERIVRTMRGIVGVGAAITFLLALFMSSLATSWFSRSLQKLIARARAHVDDDDDIGGDVFTNLYGSVSRLTDELENSLAKVADQRDRLQTVLSGIGEGVVAVKADLTVEFANEAAAKLLGVSLPFKGRNLGELIENAEVNALLEEDGPSEVEIDHDKSQLLVKKSPRQGGGVVLVMLDLTAARRLDKIRKDFIANVSHELRTPVSVVRANAEALLDGALEDEKQARRFTERIHDHAERLSGLIHDLLDLARIESGRYEPDLTNVDVRAAAEDAIRRAMPEGAHAPSLDVQGDLVVRADTTAFAQVLINLLENAFRHAEGRDVSVVAYGKSRGRIRLEVHDDGPGIKLKHRERIFERFYRVDKGRARKVGGTGLGLAIVKHLVLVHGGRVGYKPREPNGSIFWFELPEARDSV